MRALPDEDPDRLLAGYDRSLLAWFERIERLHTRLHPDEVVRTILADARYEQLDQPDRQMIEMCVRGALQTLDAGRRS